MTLDEIEQTLTTLRRGTSFTFAAVVVVLLVCASWLYLMQDEQRGELEQLHRRVGELERRRPRPRTAATSTPSSSGTDAAA